MKKIGLIGGLSWQSTLEYYRIMNVAVAERTEGKHAAKILLESLDFGEVGSASTTMILSGWRP